MMMNFIHRQKILTGVTLTLLYGGLLAGTCIAPARAVSLDDVLKVGGVLLAVNQLGDGMNHFINNLLQQHKAETMGATKVVPIVSVGQGAYIGAVQVVGVPDRVQRVQAVAAVEGVAGKLQGTLLIPISTKMPGSKLSRVDGVGVNAIVDLKL